MSIAKSKKGIERMREFALKYSRNSDRFLFANRSAVFSFSSGNAVKKTTDMFDFSWNVAWVTVISDEGPASCCKNFAARFFTNSITFSSRTFMFAYL